MGKFTRLLESTIQRYTRGGFLTGDLVNFTDDYKSNDFFKKQSKDYLDKVEEFIKSKLNIRVSAVKPVRPSYQPGNSQNEASEFLVDVVLETSPGLYSQFLTVPASILQRVDTGINLAPVPDSLKYDNEEIIDPEEVSIGSGDLYNSPLRQTSTTDVGNGKDSKTELNLPVTNTRIPAVHADKERDPAVSTARYLKGLK